MGMVGGAKYLVGAKNLVEGDGNGGWGLGLRAASGRKSEEQGTLGKGELGVRPWEGRLWSGGPLDLAGTSTDPPGRAGSPSLSSRCRDFWDQTCQG